MPEVRVSDLASAAGCLPSEVAGPPTTLVSGLVADHRQVTAGDLFVCMPSASRDTHTLLPDAAAAGATAAVVHNAEGLQACQNLGLPAILVPNVGSRFCFALGRLASRVHNDPTRQMRVFGVTGTNGKTTTAWMVRNALAAMGRKAAYLGTLGFQTTKDIEALNNTTPFPVELWALLAQARDEGVQDLVMEASSHALYERRLAGVQFDVGVFTNLSQDHLDFHGSMESYALAKRLLFTEYAAATAKPFVGAMNVADERGREWSRDLPCRVLTFGAQGADIETQAADVTVSSIALTARYKGQSVTQTLQVGGLFNVENAGSALAGLLALGHPLEESLQALGQVKAVPGRFEAIPNDRGIGIIVDYAHTPDALTLLLKSTRQLGPRKIITVFGCGGDRDRSKRPKMATAVSQGSDVAVVTSDNPRTEDPAEILKDIVVGITPGTTHHEIIDRREAVRTAIGMAEKGDIVVIAGKGHEDYQIIGRTKHPMDDRDLAREALEAGPR